VSNSARSLARKRAREKAKAEAAELAKHECSIEGCVARAKVHHVCITCENLKREKVWDIYGCGSHAPKVLKKAHTHAVAKHPVNLMKGIARQLVGEDVF
jgi:hypothetical protein